MTGPDCNRGVDEIRAVHAGKDAAGRASIEKKMLVYWVTSFRHAMLLSNYY